MVQLVSSDPDDSERAIVITSESFERTNVSDTQVLRVENIPSGTYTLVVEYYGTDGVRAVYSEPNFVASDNSGRLISNPTPVVFVPDPALAEIEEALRRTGAKWAPRPNIISDLPPEVRDNYTGEDLSREGTSPVPGFSLGGPFPPTFSWTNKDGADWTTSIRHQGGNGTCTAFAVIGATESWLNIKLGDPERDFDLSEWRLFQKGNPSTAITDENREGGWSMDSALPFLASQPAILEAYAPYGDSKPDGSQGVRFRDSLIPSHAIGVTRGFAYEIVDPRGDRNVIKDLLRSRGPLVARMSNWRDDFYYYGSGVYEPIAGASNGKDGSGKKEKSGHAFVIVGWDDNDQAWVCRNSWGPTWGAGPDNIVKVVPGSFYADRTRPDGFKRDGKGNKIPFPSPDNGYFRVKFGKAGIEERIGVLTSTSSLGATNTTSSMAIAYTSEGQLFRCSDEGKSDSTPLVETGVQTPSISPDGRKIAYRKLVGGKGDIFTIDGDGAMTNLTNTPGEDEWDPDWSPDSSMLAFAKGDVGARKICVLDLEELPFGQIADSRRRTRPRELVTIAGDNFQPEFSYDSRHLVFVNAQTNGADIHRIDNVMPRLRPGTATRIVSLPGDQSRPRWGKDHDGTQKLAFFSQEGGQRHVFLANVDGTNPRRTIQGSPAEVTGMDWAPTRTGGLYFLRDGNLYCVKGTAVTEVDILETQGEHLSISGEPY